MKNQLQNESFLCRIAYLDERTIRLLMERDLKIPISEELTARGLITEERAARFLCIAPGTPRQWRTKGRGPVFVKIAKAVYYRVSDLDAFVAAQTRTPTPVAA